jgi:tetratricopeptide (TPR) repeat protein
MLVIAKDDEFSFWDVATLQPIQRLSRDVTQYPGWVAFSQNGKLMAMEMAPAVIHLKELATGRTVAKLEDPHGGRATWQGFTPDGTQLVVVCSYSGAIHIWDLRAIRARLKAMNLDWDWPEFPPAATGELATKPLAIEVVPGGKTAVVQTRGQRVQQAIERYRRAFEANPDSAQNCNDLAWILATVPETFRNVEEALKLAEKAVRLAPEAAGYRNTLGVAYYRAGRLRETVETLQPNLKRQQDGSLAFDLYFLAMGYHRLGETVRARDYYDWAVRWVLAQRGLSAERLEELTAFRAEAEQLLGIDPKRD